MSRSRVCFFSVGCWQQLLLALVAGILNWAIFPKLGLSLLAWVGFVPLFLALHKESSKRKAFFLGLVTGLVFFFGTCHWISKVLRNYGDLSWLGAILLFLLLALYLSLFYGFFALSFSWLSSRCRLGPTLVSPLLWVSAEYLRGQLMTGFPWCLLGYAAVDNTNLAQLATLTGVYGLSFVLIIVNTALAAFFLAPSRTSLFRLAFIALGICVLTMFFALQGQVSEGLKHYVRIVQPNIDLGQKWDLESKTNLLDELSQLSLPSAAKQPKDDVEPVRLILWPETPTPFYFNHDADFRRRMQNVAELSKGYFLFGFVDFRPSAGNASQRDPYNSVGLISPVGVVISQYDKIHLVPFGEYIPYANLFFFVDKISTEVGNFKPGDHVVVSALENGHKLGAFVCYESVVPDLVRLFTKGGAEVLVNVTNDAWFGNSDAPFQHLNMARMRAIENHRYLLRAANNGISCVIDPYGRVLRTVERNQRTVLESSFEFNTVLTPYAQYGDVFAWVCLVMSLWIIGNEIRKEWSRNKNRGRIQVC